MKSDCKDFTFTLYSSNNPPKMYCEPPSAPLATAQRARETVTLEAKIVSVCLKFSCVVKLFLVAYDWGWYIVWAHWLACGARHSECSRSSALRCPPHSFCTMPCVSDVRRQKRVMSWMSQHHHSSDGLIQRLDWLNSRNRVCGNL